MAVSLACANFFTRTTRNSRSRAHWAVLRSLRTCPRWSFAPTIWGTDSAGMWKPCDYRKYVNTRENNYIGRVFKKIVSSSYCADPRHFVERRSFTLLFCTSPAR
jgi:hypothetical protein